MLLEEMSDEDLIFLMKSGSEIAERAIYRRYNNYAKHEAQSYYKSFKHSGIVVEEFYAVAFSNVHEAIMKYEHVTACFYLFWKTMVKYAIYDYVKKNSYQTKAKPLGDISLDDAYYDNNEVILFSDVVGENEKQNKLKDALDDYIYGEDHYLSEEEKIIADLFFIQERSRKDIIQTTGLGKNRVNYLIRTTKLKIQNLIKENYL